MITFNNQSLPYWPSLSVNCKYFKTNNTRHSGVARFLSFKHMTPYYRNRNKLKGVKIKLDLAKICIFLKSDDNCVFADIGWQLKIVFKDGTFEFSKDINKLNELIEKFVP